MRSREITLRVSELALEPAFVLRQAGNTHAMICELKLISEIYHAGSSCTMIPAETGSKRGSSSDRAQESELNADYSPRAHAVCMSSGKLC